MVALAGEPLTGIEGRQRGFEIAAPLVDPRLLHERIERGLPDPEEVGGGQGVVEVALRDVELGSMTVEPGQVELDATPQEPVVELAPDDGQAPRRGGPWPRRTRRA